LDWVEPSRPYLGLRDLGITPTNYFDVEPILLYYFNDLKYVPHQANIFEDEGPGPSWETPGQQTPHVIFDKRMANWPIPDPANDSQQVWEWKWLGLNDGNYFFEPHCDPQNFKLQGSMYKKEYYKHLIHDW